MKAMILAAGLGTRLLPHTRCIPKPLFSIAGRPLLDIAIKNLIDSGCEAIIINTHHLHEQIKSFLAGQTYPVPVYTRYEPRILGTGGAIKNAADFWNHRPFLVVNGDIISNISLEEVYGFHCRHDHPVTLVLCDDPQINSVSIDPNGFVLDFGDQTESYSNSVKLNLTFTGIQVLDPEILDYIPAGIYSNSIDAFKKMMAAGRKIRAFMAKNIFWNDIGTLKRYKDTAAAETIPKAFGSAFPDYRKNPIKQTRLKGDGSQRRWYRLSSDQQTLIMVDHGITTGTQTTEFDSFVNIGRHLAAADIPVAKIHYYDRFAGLIFLEDLGDTDLQTAVRHSGSIDAVTCWYKSVIKLLIKLTINGAKGFDPAWTYQTVGYDKDLILEKECRYFVEAFLKGYLGWDASFDIYRDEFCLLAEKALQDAIIGFMHRDLQSRNIMLKDDKLYFIDYQGGRMGPIQYDLASLLIDPYVELSKPLLPRLINCCIESLSSYMIVDPHKFRRCFAYCSLTRNLQILGAFGYLSSIKGKKHFERYIPGAVKTLRNNLADFAKTEFPALTALAEKISRDAKMTSLAVQAGQIETKK